MSFYSAHQLALALEGLQRALDEIGTYSDILEDALLIACNVPIAEKTSILNDFQKADTINYGGLAAAIRANLAPDVCERRITEFQKKYAHGTDAQRLELLSDESVWRLEAYEAFADAEYTPTLEKIRLGVIGGPIDSIDPNWPLRKIAPERFLNDRWARAIHDPRRIRRKIIGHRLPYRMKSEQGVPYGIPKQARLAARENSGPVRAPAILGGAHPGRFRAGGPTGVGVVSRHTRQSGAARGVLRGPNGNRVVPLFPVQIRARPPAPTRTIIPSEVQETERVKLEPTDNSYEEQKPPLLEN
ncbi:uncharacterized protein CELE_F31E9.6 [Caenorhabditis elegans]|uniref:Uncharacterized protein n=1 Tax=Caenorhabditis elegans TaxID=6239 RepID=G5EBI2_CAEEL|nr:Uncharacterized protein CELE_F31E9.6 [Caenorhabditis elegans]CAB54232.2 Uncharacterized protein CELE_F31E9.6 [Caenorhabditis elegans]|eukprot:NP_507382.1 Uncharacterized protein CELE_F31E9.6 [Caenorhabditis elegans]